ncbi:MAG: FAD-dependent oxidoreductase, partial [Acidimicrobiales bacterium]
ESRAELGTIVTYQQSELERLGVEVRTGERVDADAVGAYDVEAVIVATGSKPRQDPIDSDGSIPFVAPIEVMADPAPWHGRHVLIFDIVANMVAYAPAEALLRAGATVTIATPKLYFGSGLDMATMTTAIRRLATMGASLCANSLVTGIADGAVHIQDTMTGEARTEPADAVVAAVGNRAVDALAHSLEANARLEVHLVGDAAAPRTILEAVREGRTAGRAV